MENNKKEILFIAQYPENISPGQRFRFELYKDLLAQNNFRIHSHPFLDEHNFAINYKPGKIFSKIKVVIKGFWKRITLLRQVRKFDYIFIYREAAPVGFPIFEWIYTKWLKKKVIYDFDDAIWMPYEVTESSFFTKFFKNKGKVKKICSWAHIISCGNEYLCNYAKQFNQNVIYNPTCVDTENRYNLIANHDVQKITIGWTGSFSTLNYFENLSPVLKKLQEKYEFDIKIICNRKPDINLKNVKYIAWTAENELIELATCQIGLMPLTDEEWSKGKCGFKLIQYLALGIPAVSSSVGVNSSIIEDGSNGFLCNSEEEWYYALEKMITDAPLRKKMAIEGRKKIVTHFSLLSNKNNFLSIFN
jgi:glycosyltransferase involved in cell wall biosynthesis